MSDEIFGELIEDNDEEQLRRQELLRKKLLDVLADLSSTEREIVMLRYGLVDGISHTLEEVGQQFQITRERVREIEAKAVRKLQSSKLKTKKAGNVSGKNQNDIAITLELPEFCDEEFVTSKLVELYQGLNEMHLAADGTGLVVNDDRSYASQNHVNSGAPAL